MPDLSTILAFLVAVLWKNLVPLLITGGLPPMMEKGYEAITGKQLPITFHFKWTMLAGVLVAVFIAWDDEYTQRIELQKKEVTFEASASEVTRLNNQLRQADKDAVRQDLNINELKREKSDLLRKLEDQEKSSVATISALRQSNLEKQQKLDEKEKRKIIRENLGKFIYEGSMLLVRLEKDPIIPNEAIQSWVAQVEAFLNSNMDGSFVNDFNSGIVTMGPQHVVSDEHKRLWGLIHLRMENLKNIKRAVAL